MKILVTGAHGFIGSHFVKYVIAKTDHSVVAFTRDSDQRNVDRLCLSSEERPRIRLVHGDLTKGISGLTEGCDAVVNFAAKTFVDHSIRDPWPFIEANVIGTYHLLEDVRKNGVKYFIQISTDEVYGSILEGAYKEDARLNPTNPYAASKAGADALVISYANTFGMWTAITRTENNYGPWQGPQKAFPTFVRALLKGEKIPVYGDGKHRRQWLWVDDHCSAVLTLLHRASGHYKRDGSKPFEPIPSGQIFHVAGSQELENLELAKRIIAAYDEKLNQGEANTDPDEWWKRRIYFMDDHNVRPGHDRRYALHCDKMRALGWKPEVGLTKGIQMAVDWYVDNKWWLS
jgi:dTDP-glucose 4,6-dehydratase